MASKEKTRSLGEGFDVEDALDELEKLIDRTKVLYEQYFMGIQKIAPIQLQKDIERKMRDLTQVNMRNTGLRYRFTTMSQKFGSYNTYWKRTMHQIETGRYIRDVARVGRKALQRGEDIPAEVLQAMPKRMRDRILREREVLAQRALANEEAGAKKGRAGAVDPATGSSKPGRMVHEISEDDSLLSGDDFDLDAMFDSLQTDRGSKDSQSPPLAASPPPPARVTAPMVGAAPSPEHTPPPIPVKRAAAPPPPPGKSAAPPLPGVTPSRAATQSSAPPRSSNPSSAPPLPGLPRPATQGGAATRATNQSSAPPLPGMAPPRAANPSSAPPLPGMAPPRASNQSSAPARAATHSGTPPGPRPKPRTMPPPAVLPPGMSDAEGRELYRRFQSAREQVGDKTQTSYEQLMKSLAGKAPKILAEHGGSKVDFNVVVKGDKVVLKAKPVKK